MNKPLESVFQLNFFEEGTTLELNPAFIALEIIEEEYTPSLLSALEKDEYAVENYNLIYHAANLFKDSLRVPYSELVSVAQLGFTKALNGFDKDKGVKFSTFSVNCMKNEILHFWRSEKKHALNTISSSTVLKTGNDGQAFELEHLLVDEDGTDESNRAIDQSELREMLLQAITNLSNIEQYIIHFRYGLLDGEIKTQYAIAMELGTSQAKVSKLQRSAEEKMYYYLKKNNRESSMDIGNFTQ